jgi:hypothetical protein
MLAERRQRSCAGRGANNIEAVAAQALLNDLDNRTFVIND